MSLLLLFVHSKISNKQKAFIENITEINEKGVNYYSRHKVVVGLPPQVSEKISIGNLYRLATEFKKAIYFSKKKPNLDIKFLNQFFSNEVKLIYWVDEEGQVHDFSTSGDNEKLLFIFPGNIIPLSLGSHQRAFNLLYNLSNAGFACDLLIPENKNLDRIKLKNSLATVSHNVYFYKNNKRKFPKHIEIMRAMEKRWLGIQRKTMVLPDKFSERDFNKPTVSLKRWVNSLYIAHNYNKILVSYAWLLPAIEHIEHLKDDFQLICDTHDIQFIRNKQILSRKNRLFYSRDKEKELELSRLAKADIILAISQEDCENLKAHQKQLGKAKAVTLTTGFDYALEPVKKRPIGRPVNFGFIGGMMEANVQALEVILTKWWPEIKKYSPASTLYIAGSISKAESLQHLILFDSNILSLGFVKNLQDFYSKIEVSLNPVTVQGGLNFKSIEAVMSGKHLWTNELGKKCLGDEFICTLIDKNDDIKLFLDKYEFNFNEDQKFRQKAQIEAKKIFSNSSVNKGILSLLTSNL